MIEPLLLLLSVGVGGTCVSSLVTVSNSNCPKKILLLLSNETVEDTLVF